MTPGAAGALRLRLTNPHPYTIKVTSLSVRASTSSKPGCVANVLEVARKKKVSVRVPARGRATTLYPIRLKPTAPSACQSARWPLKFQGEARKAR
ncbi:MAG: hypothetical protein M3174_00685 [Actinomycetota bacterium]|nr:hypothetical protein [Actinomycetota bacterium]